MRSRLPDLCELGCGRAAVHTHHRKLRSQGGDDSADNLIRVCLECHDRIHANPAEAYDNGWMVKSWDHPSRVPVVPTQLTVEGSEEPWDAHKHEDETECPRCHGKGKVAKPKETETKESRPKVVYAVRVPKDERENGHEILSHLFDACIERDMSEKLLQSEKGAQYYVAVRALYGYSTRPKGE